MTPRDTSHAVLAAEDLVWALGSLCSLNRLPFSAELLLKQFPPPYSHDTLVRAARSLGFKTKDKQIKAEQNHKQAFPYVAWLNPFQIKPAARGPGRGAGPAAGGPGGRAGGRASRARI